MTSPADAELEVQLRCRAEVLDDRVYPITRIVMEAAADELKRLRQREAAVLGDEWVESMVGYLVDAVEVCIQEAMPSRQSQMRCFYDRVKESDLRRHLADAVREHRAVLAQAEQP